MTVSRIPGPALLDNLTRNGRDISIETDIWYVDVNNRRIGINKAVPTTALDITGAALFNDTLKITGANISSETTNANINLLPNGTGKVTVSTLTAGRVLYIGTGGSLVDSANLTFDGTTLTVAGISVSGGVPTSMGNISIGGNTINSTNTNGNINLTPNGTGNVIVTPATATQVFYAGANKELITNANLTFSGTQLTVTGTANATTVNAGNIQSSGNTISSSNTNGNITLSPNGTGNILVNTATATRLFYAGANKELLTDADLTFDGANLTVGNITIGNNTVTSSNANGNIYLDPNGIGKVIISTTNAVTLPVGTVSERPTGVKGDFRYNSSSDIVEYYNGSAWVALTTQGTVLGDAFSGDGVTVAFTLSQLSTSVGSMVTLNGLMQSPSVAYSVSGDVLTFTEAPAVGDSIEVRYIADYSIVNALVDPQPGTPASSTATGTKGQIKYDSSYVYICTAINTWIRAAIQSTF